MQQESKAHKNGHQNTFLTVFDFFFVSAETLHALSPTFNRFQAPTHIPHLLSLILYWFYPFSIIFICFYPNSSITAYFHLFFNINFNYFHSFSTILLDKNCFTPSSYSQTWLHQARSGQLIWLGPWPYAGQARPW